MSSTLTRSYPRSRNSVCATPAIPSAACCRRHSRRATNSDSAGRGHSPGTASLMPRRATLVECRHRAARSTRHRHRPLRAPIEQTGGGLHDGDFAVAAGYARGGICCHMVVGARQRAAELHRESLRPLQLHFRDAMQPGEIRPRGLHTICLFCDRHPSSSPAGRSRHLGRSPRPRLI